MAAPGAYPLTPTQQKALTELLGVVRSRAAPLVELRSPPTLGRGHGVTSVLRAASKALGVPLIGVSTTLEVAVTGGQESGSAVRAIHAAAVKSLAEHGMAVIDDLDLAVCPRSVKRNRTLVGSLRGVGDMAHWDVLPGPAMLLKALADVAASAGQVVLFSSLEDSHLAFMQAPLGINLGDPTANDYMAVLKGRLGDAAATAVDSSALFALHSQLTPADLAAMHARAAGAVASGGKALNTTEIMEAVRSDLVNNSAVSPEDVEEVDLSKYPGLEGIKEELEKHVLYPMENPEKAAQFGLTPKRGVLVHGQPGTGKTTVGRWLAHRLKGKFFLVGEMTLHADIIKLFAAAKAAAPAVIFIDDADIVIGGWRPLDGHRGSDIFRFLLGSMDGITSRGEKSRTNGDVVIMLTAQNVHWMAEMLLRSGRIELWLKTKLPDPKVKREILKKYIKQDPGALELLGANGECPDVRAAAQASDHFCCADLRRIVNDAKVLAAWDRSAGKVTDATSYLEQAAQAVRQMQDEVQDSTRHLYG